MAKSPQPSRPATGGRKRPPQKAPGDPKRPASEARAEPVPETAPGPPPNDAAPSGPADPAHAHNLRLRDLIGRPAVARFEALQDYEDIYRALCDTLQPADIIEAGYVKDLADGYMAVSRYKRVMNTHITRRSVDGVKQILSLVATISSKDFGMVWDLEKLAGQILKKGPEQHREFKGYLNDVELSPLAITDFAILGDLTTHMTVQKLVDDSLRRNDRTLRALLAYREQRLKQIVPVNTAPSSRAGPVIEGRALGQ